MYEMHLALFLKVGCYSGRARRADERFEKVRVFTAHARVRNCPGRARLFIDRTRRFGNHAVQQ
jgi:hypothetical protein